jgi:hypothetical protein
MDWPNEFPPLTVIDRVVGETAQKLMRGPVVFRSPYWNGEVVIESLDDYRAWARFADRINNERGAERRASQIWEEKKDEKSEETGLEFTI